MRRRVKRVIMVGKARRCKGAQFPSEHDTGRRFLLVPFLEEQLRDRTANKDNHL